MRVAWSVIQEESPLRMHALMAFMERFSQGSTADARPATREQIAALAELLGGTVDRLPRVYLDFLQTMGEQIGKLRLTRGITSISALLADRRGRGRAHVDSQRYFKFAIGEDDYNGRQPDDFFDLHRIWANGEDAAIIRIREEDLIDSRQTPDEPFGSFSDLVRSVMVNKLCKGTRADKLPAVSFGFGTVAGATVKVYELLAGLGFELTELGASPRIIPLENTAKRAVALLAGPSPTLPDTGIWVRTLDEKYLRHITEVLSDYRAKLRGLA